MAARRNWTKLIQTLDEDPNHDLEEIQELILETTLDEIRSSPKLFTILCHSLTKTLVKSKRSIIGINLISNAITKLQTHGSQLTQLHSDLCLLCLDSKCLNPALSFLDIDYTEIKKTEDKEEDVSHVLFYYYYGGLIYAAVKNFERASYFFEVILTIPANVVNPVMQETLKKQILLNLLIDGKLSENMLPKSTSSCVLRQKKHIGHSYIKLAHEYASLNHERIRRAIVTNSSAFERDGNMGLMKQCLTQVHKRNIQRLTKTFLTLPLRDVANHVGLSSEKEAEAYILNMIDSGEIFAKINQRDGMVVFEEDLEKYDSVHVFQKLQEDMSTSSSLINILKRLDIEASNDTKMMTDV